MNVDFDNMRRIHTGDLNKLGRCLGEVEEWVKNRKALRRDVDDLFDELKRCFDQVAQNQNIANLLWVPECDDFHALADTIKVSFMEKGES